MSNSPLFALFLIGIVLTLLGIIIWAEVENKRVGKSLVILGAIHMIPGLLKLWFLALLGD